jgi:two-component system OmpR family sensor kinase
MSSSQPTERLRWRPANWTLRTRLLAAMIALLAAMSVIIGVVSVLALDRFLHDRLDDQLTSAGGRSTAGFGQPPRRPPGGDDRRPVPGFLLVQGQGEGTLGAHIARGVVTEAAVLDSSGNAQQLSAAQEQVLVQLPVDGRPHSRDLDDGLGEYRLLATYAPDGDVIVTGLPLRSVEETVYGLAAVVIGVAVIGLIAATLVGAAIVRLTLRPLRRVAATASRVAELPLDRGEVALAVRVPDTDTDPRTEVGQVGAALNRMLGHVAAALTARQASEMRVRQFVADASHELRTPLASIRGYAELTRRGADAVPADVAHALGRVESEATRMTTLVEDLLLLARLDAGRPVEHRPVDLSRLVVDTLGDAHAAGRDHDWQLELPEQPMIVTGDPAKLHQVVANLLANARMHTPPGTTVTVSLRSDPDEGPADGRGDAVLAVVDDGPGIPPELLPAVFERFARGDSSRSRASGSTGLGLAIVAAVVEAHNGTVDVTSRRGRTAFTIRLPLGNSDADGPLGRR